MKIKDLKSSAKGRGSIFFWGEGFEIKKDLEDMPCGPQRNQGNGRGKWEGDSLTTQDRPIQERTPAYAANNSLT